MRVTNSRDLGLIVRDARLRRGLSQKDLADLVGASRQWVANLENDRTDPRLSLVLAVLDVLELPMDLRRINAGNDHPKNDGLPNSLDDVLGALSDRHRS
jgi:transcriptional regulator with XRE-family HTH domain